jgi:NADPH:quinone reductase-like Zn-dependent oxidoreductase
MLMNMPSKGKYLIGWFSTGRNEAARDLSRAVWRSIKEGEIYLHIQQ